MLTAYSYTALDRYWYSGVFRSIYCFSFPAIGLTQILMAVSLSSIELRLALWTALLITQVLTGYWLGSESGRRALIPLLIVMLLDCVLGLLNLNTASIDMAVLSLPLLIGVLFARKSCFGAIRS